MSVASRQQTGQKPCILRPHSLLEEKGMWSLFSGRPYELSTPRGRTVELVPLTVSYFSTANILTEPPMPKVSHGALFTTAESWDCSPQRAEADFKVTYRLEGRMLLIETESDAIIRAYRTMRMAEELFVMGFSVPNAIAHANSLALECNPFTLDHETLLMPKAPGREIPRAKLDQMETQNFMDKMLFERRGNLLPPARELPRDYTGAEIVPGGKTIIALARPDMDEGEFSRILENLRIF